MYFHVRSLPLETAQWLMDHDPGIRQAKALAFRTRSKQERSHACSLSYAKGADIRFNILHGVVDRHSG